MLSISNNDSDEENQAETEKTTVDFDNTNSSKEELMPDDISELVQQVLDNVTQWSRHTAIRVLESCLKELNK